MRTFALLLDEPLPDEQRINITIYLQVYLHEQQTASVIGPQPMKPQNTQQLPFPFSIPPTTPASPQFHILPLLSSSAPQDPYQAFISPSSLLTSNPPTSSKSAVATPPSLLLLDASYSSTKYTEYSPTNFCHNSFLNCTATSSLNSQPAGHRGSIMRPTQPEDTASHVSILSLASKTGEFVDSDVAKWRRVAGVLVVVDRERGRRPREC